ncbi:hypothetical protein NHX12_005004 [Muraenolepis orangiensis]|uniref:Uncharacterized protein n=1 Tax=Muraenolepis orangiensis TaxID=630683 RepID=A0A9Q0DWA1_9TELE|nr:hypothetical protein NHX12_005004 [Muraenolepis orangiensis]
MSKLSFRARALDAAKPLPVFRSEDLPDLHEYASINRAVPQMPTGMEKEEESGTKESRDFSDSDILCVGMGAVVAAGRRWGALAARRMTARPERRHHEPAGHTGSPGCHSFIHPCGWGGNIVKKRVWELFVMAVL